MFPVPGIAPGTQSELTESLMANEWVLQMGKLRLGERLFFGRGCSVTEWWSGLGCRPHLEAKLSPPLVGWRLGRFA